MYLWQKSLILMIREHYAEYYHEIKKCRRKTSRIIELYEQGDIDMLVFMDAAREYFKPLESIKWKLYIYTVLMLFTGERGVGLLEETFDETRKLRDNSLHMAKLIDDYIEKIESEQEVINE